MSPRTVMLCAARRWYEILTLAEGTRGVAGLCSTPSQQDLTEILFIACMYTWFMQVASWSVSSAHSLGEVRRTGYFFMKTRSIYCSQQYSYSVFNKYILINILTVYFFQSTFKIICLFIINHRLTTKHYHVY